MSNERQLRYASDDNQYEGQNLFGWDNTNLKDTTQMLEKCLESEGQRALTMWGFNTELESPDNSSLTSSRWMYMIDKSLDEKLATSEVKTISCGSFRGRKLTSGSATSDYYSFNGDVVGSMQDYQKNELSQLENSEMNELEDEIMDYGCLEKLEMPSDKTAS